MSTSVILSRDPLQTLRVDAIGYGAKDTGEMGGGAAAAVFMAAGPEIAPALQAQLAASSRNIGEAVLTDSFKLHAVGIHWVIHIISIIKNTPQGAYCPSHNDYEMVFALDCWRPQRPGRGQWLCLPWEQSRGVYPPLMSPVI